MMLVIGSMLLIWGLGLLLPGLVFGRAMSLLFGLLLTGGATLLILEDRRAHRSPLSWWRKFQPERWEIAVLGVMVIVVGLVGGFVAGFDSGKTPLGWKITPAVGMAMVVASPFLPKRPKFDA